jgi:hypothetical protein
MMNARLGHRSRPSLGVGEGENHFGRVVDKLLLLMLILSSLAGR